MKSINKSDSEDAKKTISGCLKNPNYDYEENWKKNFLPKCQNLPMC